MPLCSLSDMGPVNIKIQNQNLVTTYERRKRRPRHFQRNTRFTVLMRDDGDDGCDGGWVVITVAVEG